MKRINLINDSELENKKASNNTMLYIAILLLLVIAVYIMYNLKNKNKDEEN